MEKLTMARHLTLGFLNLQAGVLLLLALFCSTANGFTLEDRLQLQHLTENYVKLTHALAAKDARLEALELKVIVLEETVQQQEQVLDALHKEIRQPSSAEISPRHFAFQEQSRIGKSFFPRTCREVRAADPSLSSGMHWIDPDGQGVGDDPIYVYCDMTSGSTSILHDSESTMDVGHCAEAGCYSRAINYNATLRQIQALAELSNECHQSIRYDCNFAPLELNGIAYAWWNDKNGNSQYFWAGNDASVHTCQCGIDHDCVDTSTTCNCDSAAPVPLTDNGIVASKDLLPVTRLNYGRTQLETSSGIHTLGRFECSGQIAVSGMPSSCADLWRIGHSLGGLYTVMGSTQVESVYCDFTKLPSDTNFQTWLGSVDVKSSPVYFYVQRSSSFNTTNIPIPFQLEKLNVGGAMDLASGIFTAPRPGTYVFSFSGVSGSESPDIGLYVNGGFIGAGNSEPIFYTMTLQSTLHLNAGDQVTLQMFVQGSLHDSGGHYTHFNGWLLQEDLA